LEEKVGCLWQPFSPRSLKTKQTKNRAISNPASSNMTRRTFSKLSVALYVVEKTPTNYSLGCLPPISRIMAPLPSSITSGSLGAPD
jgi:hypothetical protein